ncbi:MAG: DUF721 domain-containing protein [Rhodocyclaceae bacterium]|nr:DUF721 domain-containing protein [Rhodocyclaceae bacterium]MBX3671137.1 DUF721 domain-containing protein [Rhodocyclaceae bacterium]
MPARKFDQIVSESDALARFRAQTERIARMQRHYEKVAPTPLKELSHVANFKQDVLVLCAYSGAVAARLRQLTPSLCGAFEKNGVKLSGITVIVQAPRPADASSGRLAEPRLIPAEAREHIENLSESLGEQDSLGQALKRLLERSR